MAPVPFGWKLCFSVVPKTICLTVNVVLGALAVALALAEPELELELELELERARASGRTKQTHGDDRDAQPSR